MYLPRLIAHNHADAVAALKARRGALLDAANNALDLAAVVNHACSRSPNNLLRNWRHQRRDRQAPRRRRQSAFVGGRRKAGQSNA